MKGFDEAAEVDDRGDQVGGTDPARRAFDEAVTRFIARPQLRCHLEQLTAAALDLHDAGVAALERRNGRPPGSFGGRLAGKDLNDARRPREPEGDRPRGRR